MIRDRANSVSPFSVRGKRSARGRPTHRARRAEPREGPGCAKHARRAVMILRGVTGPLTGRGSPVILAIGMSVLLLATVARGQDKLPPEIAAIPFEQKLGEGVPLEAAFLDEHGQVVTIGKLLNQKPAVLVLGYQRCPRLCSLVLSNLVTSLEKVSFNVGSEFSVIDLSIDPREDPEMGREAQKSAVERYGRGTIAGWHFLTGREPEIRGVAEAIGFNYRWDKTRREFQHPSGIVLLTADGRVARYLFGIDFTPRDLRLGLVEASEGKIASPADRVLLLTCLSYDPATGRYTPTAMLLVRAGAIVTIIALGLFLITRQTSLIPRWR